MAKWTRERIIRDILRRESGGLPLGPGGEGGVDAALYQAGTRIFGSWPNAVMAAGIAPDRALVNQRWTPDKILVAIRSLARRGRPMRPRELPDHHGYLVQVARRYFGSWSRAVVSAGVDPLRLRRVAPWSRERVIETVLTRALRSGTLGRRSTQPRSLVAAAVRLFGSWEAALAAAGLDPSRHGCAARRPSRDHAAGDSEGANAACAPGIGGAARVGRVGPRWSDEKVLQAIWSRLRQRRPMNAAAVFADDTSLYRAAARRHGNWANALSAAGLNPDEFRSYRRTASIERKQ